MTGQRAYLDHNASAPLCPVAREAMLRALENGANPSSVHAEGRASRRIIERAREQVALLAGGSAENVVFTSGATEAASMLLTPEWMDGRTPLRMSRLHVCASDHPCLLKGGRFEPGQVTVMPVTSHGLLDLRALRAALDRHDASEGLPLVAVHAANNETGVIQPWREIAGIVRAAGGLFVLDAVQAAGRLALDIVGDADFLILSSHKIGGPKGAGAIVARSGRVMPKPLVSGGGQERGHRGGTENVPALAGFGAAAEAAGHGLARTGEMAALRDRFEAALMSLAPDALIHGRAAPRLANTAFFSIPGVKAETAQIAFDLAGVALSAGSACSSGKVGPSHVLEAMGVESQGALRVSIGLETGEADLFRFEDALKTIVAKRPLGRNAWDERRKVELIR